MAIDVLSSALLIGLLGAGHCVGMCGGISSALTFAIQHDSAGKRASLIVAYNLGRIFSYVLIGTIAATVAAYIQHLGFPYFRVVAGVLMILMGFYLSGWWRILTWLERGGKGLWQYLQPIGSRLLPVQNARSAFFLGAIWGWLPCGLVYTALAFSATQADAAHGALVMLAFGIGTLPAVVTGGLAAQALKSFLQSRGFRYFSAVLMILFGLWTIYGSLGHAGHHSAEHGDSSALQNTEKSEDGEAHEHHHHH